MEILLLIAVLLVAAANDANDNFNGVAILYGSGVAGYRASLACWSPCRLALCSVQRCSVWRADPRSSAVTIMRGRGFA